MFCCPRAGGRCCPIPCRRCLPGSPSPRGASPSTRDCPEGTSQPGVCSRSSISCSFAFSRSACGRDVGHGDTARGPGHLTASAGRRPYPVLHQPVAGGARQAAGARRVGEEVGLALLALVTHKAGAADAGAVLVALRRDGAQRGAVAGCNGDRKASHCGCQPQFWDRGGVPCPGYLGSPWQRIRRSRGRICRSAAP